MWGLFLQPMHSWRVMAAAYYNQRFTPFLQRGSYLFRHSIRQKAHFQRARWKGSQAMTKRTNILRALGGTTWGWRPAELRTIYITIQRSLAEYGSQAWAPWLSKSNLGKLESAQLNAARAITGHLRSTPGEFVLKEAHLTPLEAR